MFKYFLEGLLLGFAYVAPIGMQNLYLINTAVRELRKKALKVALVIIFFDISLALACFFGIGILLNSFPVLKGIMLFLGSIMLLFIGVSLMLSHPQTSSDDYHDNSSFMKIIAICFAITWFNPQAIIDGSLLLGGFYAYLPPGISNYFILGVCLASCTWFSFLSLITSFFRAKVNHTVIKWINTVCGSIIIFYGIKLGYTFIQLLSWTL
jgi:L-lysine exporter family protein LysE/ArgO